MKRHLFLLVLLVVPFSIMYAQTDRATDKFTVYDYLELDRVGSLSYSPDGKQVLFSLRTNTQWNQRGTNSMWLANPKDGTLKELTSTDKADFNLQWSPDGSKVAFQSSRSDTIQVFTFTLDTGTIEKVTNAPEGVSGFQWVNDDSIVYTMERPTDSLQTKAVEEAGGGYVYGSQFKTTQLFVQDIKTQSLKEIPVGNLYISGFSSNSDATLFGLVTGKDSYLYNIMANPTFMIIDSQGNVKYTYDGTEALGNPIFSPSGSKIAFTGSSVGYSAANSILVYDLKTASLTNLTETFDPTVEHYEWLDDENIVFSTPRHTYTGIYKVNQNKTVQTILNPAWRILSFAMNKNSNEVVFVGGRINQPYELFSQTYGKKNSVPKQLTFVNQDKMKFNFSSSNVISYNSYDGTPIEAVVFYPPNYDKTKKYPLLVIPHGGPDSISMNGFELFGLLFSQEGYVVITPNFRGSIGYGVKFYEANRGVLGYVDYEDIISGIDYLIAQGVADPDKLLVGGWSYGGYMTNWIIGHTNRFKAAVSVAGISNTVSMYGQSDINHGEIAEWEFRGVPATNIDTFLKSSPLSYLEGCNTPTLILHGESDSRVPYMQAMELYIALQDLGVETELVLYPGAEHGISAPKQFTNVINRWLAWYKAHLN